MGDYFGFGFGFFRVEDDVVRSSGTMEPPADEFGDRAWADAFDLAFG